MEDRHREVLLDSRDYLRENLDVSYILDHMVRPRILTPDMVQEILARNGKTEQTTRFLDMLPFRGPRAYPEFLNVLKSTDNEFIAEHLETLESTLKVKAESMNGLLSFLPPDQLQGRVSEQELCLIARNIGTEWERLGVIMDFKQGRIDQFKMSSQYDIGMQAQRMFNEWRRREASNATREKLVSLMKKAHVPEEVYAEVMQEYYKDKHYVQSVH